MVADLKQEVQQIVKALMCVDDLCPDVKGAVEIGKLLIVRTSDLDKKGTKTLFTMQPYRYTGELHSTKYNHTLRANDVVLQLKPDEDGPADSGSP